MNKKLLFITLFVAIAAVGTIAYFKYIKSGDQLRVIPKDAAVVVSVDLKSLADKAHPEKFKDMKFFKKMSEGMSTDTGMETRFMKRVMQNPMVTGVNFLQSFYFFMAVKNEKPVMGISATLLSKSTFEEFLDSMPVKNTVTDKGKYKFIHPDGKTYIAWDGKSALFLMVEDTLLDGKSYIDELMSQGASGSITANDKFNKFNANKGDITAFINYSQLYPAMQKRPGMSMTALPPVLTDFYKSMCAGACLNFEKNSVVMNNYCYYDDKVNDDKHQLLKSKGLNGDALKCLTDKNLFGFFSFSVDVKKIFALFENESGVQQMFGEMQAQLGLSKDDIRNLLGGDLTFSFTDVRSTISTHTKYDFDPPTGKMITREVTDTTMMPMFTLMASINDKNVLHKIIEKTGLQKTGDYYTIPIPYVADICLVESSTGIVATNDKDLAGKLGKNKSLAAVPDNVKGLLSDYPVSMYMNFNMNDYPQVMKDNISKQMGSEYYTKFNNVISLFKEFRARGTMQEGKTELTLADGNDNSLYRIIERIDANMPDMNP